MKSQSSWDTLAYLLRAKGVELNTPAGNVEIRRFCNINGILLSKEFNSMYKIFNGFMTYDLKSQIILYSIDRVFAVSNSKNKFYYIIGDFLIDSDQIVCEIGREEAPILLLAEGRQLAENIHCFITKVVRGDLDFL